MRVRAAAIAGVEFHSIPIHAMLCHAMQAQFSIIVQCQKTRNGMEWKASLVVSKVKYESRVVGYYSIEFGNASQSGRVLSTWYLTWCVVFGRAMPCHMSCHAMIS
jgi:hypothetical protein